MGIGTTATPLAGNWRALLSELRRSARVMCLTRNEHCVHERHGRFEDVQVTGPHGPGAGIRHRPAPVLGKWRYGFAVREPLKRSDRRSLQFFDAAGDAVHKIYATDETDRRAFDTLVARHRTSSPLEITVVPRAREAIDRPDSEVDIEGLRAAWRAMTDTHQFLRACWAASRSGACRRCG